MNAHRLVQLLQEQIAYHNNGDLEVVIDYPLNPKIDPDVNWTTVESLRVRNVGHEYNEERVDVLYLDWRT